MLTKLLHRLYGIVIIGCILLCPVLSGCDDDTVNGFLQFSDDNLLLRAAGDTVVIDVTAGSGWTDCDRGRILTHPRNKKFFLAKAGRGRRKVDHPG